MRLYFLSFLILSLLSSSCAITVHFKDARTPVQLKSVYTTLGVYPDTPKMYNITLIHPEEFDCHFPQPELIQGRLVIYTGFMFKDEIFRKCLNYFYDSYTNGAYFTHTAEQAGAAAVVFRGSYKEERYTGFRLAGFKKGIKIHVIASTEDAIKYIVDNYDAISSVEIPPIEQKDADFLRRLKSAFRGLNIYNAIVCVVLALLTAWLTFVDFRAYLRSETKVRTLHPTLTKFVPCIASTFGAIWLIGDPFNFKLSTHFPANFFLNPFVGFVLVTCAILLKTLVLAVGKLKSPIVFKTSIWILNILASAMALITVIWTFVGMRGATAAIIIGAILIAICGIGFIYYGKDIYVILSKGTTEKYRNLSYKIVIFVVIFIVCSYATMFVYFLRIFGAVISLFIMMVIVGTGFILMYSILFLRRSTSASSDSTGSPKTTADSTGHSGDTKMKRVDSQSSTASITATATNSV